MSPSLSSPGDRSRVDSEEGSEGSDEHVEETRLPHLTRRLPLPWESLLVGYSCYSNDLNAFCMLRWLSESPSDVLVKGDARPVSLETLEHQYCESQLDESACRTSLSVFFPETEKWIQSLASGRELLAVPRHSAAFVMVCFKFKYCISVWLIYFIQVITDFLRLLNLFKFGFFRDNRLCL